MRVPEELLHYVWQFKKLSVLSLYTCAGEKIRIVETGFWNRDAGPDFINSKLLIGNTLWSGNVEIHCFASDWNKHGHQHNQSYDNVILHVVLHKDTQVCRSDGSEVATLEIADSIQPYLLEKYNDTFQNLATFPCANLIQYIDPFVIYSQLERSSIERLIFRSNLILSQLQTNKGDWEETTFQLLAKNFGFHLNGVPFEMLAKSILYKRIQTLMKNQNSIEAILFGQAGFLKKYSNDSYYKSLRAIYQHFKLKYQLQPFSVDIWKFLRMRPVNFPTVRIAQFAAFLNQTNKLFDVFINTNDPLKLIQIFKDLKVSAYWQTHYHFQKECRQHTTNIGLNSIHNLLINTVASLLFAYGRYSDSHQLKNRAIELLEILPAEKNHIIALYTKQGLLIKNAFQSQGLIDLHHQYCTSKKCLQCKIGLKLMS